MRGFCVVQRRYGCETILRNGNPGERSRVKMSDESTNDSTSEEADKYKLETGPTWCPNPALDKCNAQAGYVAPFPVHILLLGPTGSGKSRLARFIHAKSGRKYMSVCNTVWNGIKGERLKDMLSWAAGEDCHDEGKGDKRKPNRGKLEGDLKKNKNGVTLKNQEFREINLAALPQQTISSELFGYVEGAYTDANRHGSPGKFIQANGGTLFLDEIADCPMEIQAKLLNVIQPRRKEDGDCACYVIPNGQEETVRVNVRLICATNKDLAEEVKKGNFRQDLYYRLKQYEIKLPSLKQLKVGVNDNDQYFGHMKKIKEEERERRNKVVKRDLEENAEQETEREEEMFPNEEEQNKEEKKVRYEEDFSSVDIEFFMRHEPEDEEVLEQFYLRWFIQKVLKDVNEKLNNSQPRYKAKQLEEESLNKLLTFRFGGNYRELQSCLMQACLNAYTSNMLNASAEGGSLDDADQEIIIADNLPEEVVLEENGQPRRPNVSEVMGNSRSNVEDVQNGLPHLKNVFYRDELECLEDMLRRGVCDGASLEAVAKKMPERVQSADGAKGAGGNKEKRGSDLSDIRNFAYLIGAIEKAPDAKKSTIAESVFGKGSSTAKIDSLLGKPKNPKFGISFESIKNAVKSCASTKRPAEE